MQRSCTTCRARRRACDKTRPQCSSCIRLQRRCEYDDSAAPLFVNFSEQNIRTRQKRVLCDAIESRKASSDEKKACRTAQAARCYAPTSSSITTSELLLQSDLSEHVTTLWSTFVAVHSITPDAWTHSFFALTSQSRALDLTLIAVSTFRLSIDTDSPRLRLMSLTAYDSSLKLFRGMLEHARPLSPALVALQSIVALGLALFDGVSFCPSGSSLQDLLRQNMHLKACERLIAQCGPEAFQYGGMHAVFRTIRELLVLTALTHGQRSLMCESRWMELPWRYTPKAWRDRLWDVVVKATEVVEIAFGRVGTLDLEEYVRRVEELEQSLRSVQYEYGLHEHECTQFESRLFMECDFKALWLLLALLRRRRFTSMDELGSPQCITSDDEVVFSLAQQLRQDLATHTIFDRNFSRPGAMEGQCRALLARWVLELYDSQEHNQEEVACLPLEEKEDICAVNSVDEMIA